MRRATEVAIWMVSVFSMVWMPSVLPSCGASPPDDPCENAPTYDDVVAPTVVAVRCIQCHSARLQGRAREGAPTGVDFDTYETVEPRRVEVASAVTSGLMPPPDLDPALATTKAERELVERWARCGYPR